MKKILYILLPAYILLINTACKKNAYPVYDANQPYMNVWMGASVQPEDSTVYNYSFKPDRPVDSVLFTARLMGLHTGKPVTFSLKAVDGDTLKIKEGVHYRFGNYSLENNTYSAVLPIYILRTKDFADTGFSITFAVSDASAVKGGTKEYSRLKLRLTDRFVKPFNWDADVYPFSRLSTYFGTFSRVKFQFITNSTGVAPAYRIRTAGSPTSADEIYATQARYYSNTSKSELATYNATHATPLTDENGIAVTF